MGENPEPDDSIDEVDEKEISGSKAKIEEVTEEKKSKKDKITSKT